MLNNPYGCHTQFLSGPAKQTMLSQHNARILKLVSPTALDRSFLSQWRAQNPDALIIYRHYFGDNNLDDVNGRAQAIVNAVSPYRDLIDVVETGYNECNEGINDGIRDLAQAEMRMANRLRQSLHGMKVAGGCFSVGTPYNDVTKGEFQDIEAYASAFAHLNYWAPHEYRNPASMEDIRPIDGRAYGATVLRYRYVIDWAKEADVDLPPIYLGEFGFDGGGAGKGWRAIGPSLMGYMHWAGHIAQYLMEDIGAGHLVGAVFFCVGQDDPDSWGSFDLAGENAFQDLLSEQFGAVAPRPSPSATSLTNTLKTPPMAPQGESVSFSPTGHTPRLKTKPPTEFEQWSHDPANRHDPDDRQAYLDAFIAHREANVKAATGRGVKLTLRDALAGGYPPHLLPEPVRKPNKLELQERMVAKRLGVPLCRVQAVYRVESNGQPFSQAGRATIRFEVHGWINYVPGDKLVWAQENFRVHGGVEEILRIDDDGGKEWESVQAKDQAGRWADLILAVQISGDLAFQWTSMGLFQILGLHYEKLHYESARDMLQAFSHNEGAQWRGFEDFVLANGEMHKHMVDGDADRFGLAYNNSRRYGDLLRREGWE